MNRLITRLQRRSRVAVGSTMALIVSLPLGATIGLASTATAAPSPEPAAATDIQAKKAPEGTGKAGTAETASTLGDAVPWTADPKASAAAAAEESFDALLFSKTAAFRHSNIDEATTAIQELGGRQQLHGDATEDSSAFNDANLAQYEVVIFLSTTGDVLNADRAGRVRALHPGRRRLRRHPRGLRHRVRLALVRQPRRRLLQQPPGGHAQPRPSRSRTRRTRPPPACQRRWQRTDEWYNFRTNPAADPHKVHVLAALDETTYTPGTARWAPTTRSPGARTTTAAAAWYTGMGHTEASYVDPAFLRPPARRHPDRCRRRGLRLQATLTPSFEKVALDEQHLQPDGARHRRRRPGVLHRPRRRACRSSSRERQRR